MGMPALKLEFEEVEVEERLARLETSVEHIQSDVSELKGDIRRLDSKLERLNDKVDGVKDSVAALALSTEKGFSKMALWAMTLFVSLGAGLLSVIARSFHWL